MNPSLVLISGQIHHVLAQLLYPGMMEPLEELPFSQWPELQAKLKKLWPMNLPAYYAVKQNITYEAVRNAFQFKIYCPYGDLNNGFVATTIKSTMEVIAFSIDENTTKLAEALINTKRINWKQTVCFDLVSSLILVMLERIKPTIGWKEYYVGKLHTFMLPKDTTPFVIINPPGFYSTPLGPENIQRVDETWPYQHSASHFYFSTLNSNGLAYGLYSSDKNELVSWVFMNEYNFLAHLYCEEAYRRKGYAEYVMMYAVNDQLRRGNDVYGYVVVDNDMSKALFRKLGFINIDDSAYLYVKS